MIAIRRLRLGEADLYRQVRLSALREAPYAFSSTYEGALLRSPASWIEQADGSALGPDRATYVALAGDAPVGLAALYRTDTIPDVALLRQVWVSPEHRGRGVASALLDALFQWARENGYRAVLADVALGNARALRFYRRYGFGRADAAMAQAEDGEVTLIKDV